MKSVVAVLGLALLLGVAACSRRDAGAPPLLHETAPYEIAPSEGDPTLEPATLQTFTPSRATVPPTSPPTKRPSPTLVNPKPTEPPPTPTPGEGVGESVPFFSIAKGAAGSRRLDVREPTLEVVRNSGQLEDLIRWNRLGYVPRRVKEGLQGIRMLTTFVVVAYSGPQATDGHKITIQEVRLDEGTVIVTVAVTSPLPGRAASDVLTHPYHVVGIFKQDMFVSPEVNWLMVTEDGTVLAELKRPKGPKEIRAQPAGPVVTPEDAR